MAFVDWYAVLAIEPSADAAAVRRAYRRAALKYHPDKNPDAGAADTFDLLTQAAAVLTDAARRAAFDTARAQRAAVLARRTGDSARIEALKARLGTPSSTPPSTGADADVELLRDDSAARRRALDALRAEMRAEAPAFRTLADGSRTFASVADARAFVDEHGARLRASWRPSHYSAEYESATLDRLATAALRPH